MKVRIELDSLEDQDYGGLMGQLERATALKCAAGLRVGTLHVELAPLRFHDVGRVDVCARRGFVDLVRVVRVAGDGAPPLRFVGTFRRPDGEEHEISERTPVSILLDTIENLRDQLNREHAAHVRSMSLFSARKP